MHRSLWVPGGREEPFFPLCPRRPSWIRCPRTGAGLPPARIAEHAPSDIIRTRSRRYASFWRACCCSNCLTALFAGCLRTERRHRTRLPRCNFAGVSVLRGATRRRAIRLPGARPQRYSAHRPFPFPPTPCAGRCPLQTDNRTRAAGLPCFGPTDAGTTTGVSQHRPPQRAVSQRSPHEEDYRSPPGVAPWSTRTPDLQGHRIL